ncbi:hypothetical protein, partial [Candidatus Aquicultor secundus]
INSANRRLKPVLAVSETQRCETVPIINSANRKRTKAIKYTLMVIIEDVVHIATHALPRSA